jgi:SAM-dependent methyltransferase
MLARKEKIMLICGRYEGIDERVSLLAADDEISVGDYVLSGGELGAMVIIDTISRLLPGVLGNSDSTKEESFSDFLLEYPQYTRSVEFRGLRVPDVLLSGNHKKIAEWRKEKAIKKNLGNIDFHLQDVTKLDMGKKYHVITCAYALFFLPDPIAVLKSLVAHLRPNGIVIFTTFTAEAFTPSSEILIPLLVKYGSSSAKEYDADSWKNLKHKRDIERLCQMALVGDVNVHTKDIRYGLSVDDWWELMNNTGFKGMLLELSVEDYEQVKTAYYQAMLTHADMDGEVELIADSNFVIVDR